MLSQVYNRMTIHYLPVIEPTAEEVCYSHLQRLFDHPLTLSHTLLDHSCLHTHTLTLISTLHFTCCYDEI